MDEERIGHHIRCWHCGSCHQDLLAVQLCSVEYDGGQVEQQQVARAKRVSQENDLWGFAI